MPVAAANAERTNYNDGGATPLASNITAADMVSLATAVNQLQQTITAVKTTTYTAAANEFVPCDATTAAFTVTLPTTPADGSTVTVTKVDASSNAVTIARGGTSNIVLSGITSVQLESQGRTITLAYISAVSLWYVVASRDTSLTPGIVDQEQFITSTATRTLTSQTAAQKIFATPTNGQVTLAIGTYFFECLVTLSTLSATAGSFGFTLGVSGAVIAGQVWRADALKAVIATPAAPLTSVQTAAAANLAGTTSTATVGWMHLQGKFRLSTGGGIIPQITLNTAAAAVVGADSFFRVWPAGLNTVTSIGSWT